jgi:hypothetical protein
MSRTITSNVHDIKKAQNIVILCLAVALVPVFYAWMHFQINRGKPALIPNSLWRDRVFSSICACVVSAWGGFYATEQLMSLWLQLVQSNSALGTSLRFLPETIVGVMVNAVVGLFVHRLPCRSLVVVTNVISLASPILMALSHPGWTYWAAAFPAISIIVIGPDTLYTVSNLLITKTFPEDAQGLAGGVFNTASQVGKTMGLALSGVVVTSTKNVTSLGKVENLLESYRAGFWFCVGLNALTVAISFWGLRKTGRIGMEEVR